MIIKIDHSLVWQKGLKPDVGRIVETVEGWGAHMLTAGLQVVNVTLEVNMVTKDAPRVGPFLAVYPGMFISILFKTEEK